MASKPVETVKDPAVAWAEQLWQRLETDLFNVEKTIIAIIETKAWEPLGYESFSKAWVDKIMSKVSISTELRPHVVYQMFSEGLTAEQVADAVKGVSPESANRLKRQKDAGVPADRATTTVREHQRKLPGDWRFLHLKVGTDELKEWQRIASENEMSLKTMALEALRTYFGEFE